MILTYAKRRRKSCLAPIGAKRRVRVNMGRRFEKKGEVNGGITLHEGCSYHGYLQIACVNLQKPFQAAKRYITWVPTQFIATCPLAIQKDGTWYTYGWDLTKNICEIYGPSGFIRTTYTPYGSVTADGDVEQAIQWSSEYHDTELGLVYYNYRYYNPQDGRWTRRDPIGIEGGVNLYAYVENKPIHLSDALGNIKWAGYGALVEAILAAANGYLQRRISNCPSKYPKSKADCEACINNAIAALIVTTTAAYTIGLVGCAVLSLFLAIACIAALSYAKIMAMESIMEAKDNAMKGCCK